MLGMPLRSLMLYLQNYHFTYIPERVIPFFAYPPEIRKVVYTTNAIESLNMSLRKVIKSKGAFPHDDAVFKIFYLALRGISKKSYSSRMAISYFRMLPTL